MLVGPVVVLMVWVRVTPSGRVTETAMAGCWRTSRRWVPVMGLSMLVLNHEMLAGVPAGPGMVYPNGPLGLLVMLARTSLTGMSLPLPSTTWMVTGLVGMVQV